MHVVERVYTWDSSFGSFSAINRNGLLDDTMACGSALGCSGLVAEIKTQSA